MDEHAMEPIPNPTEFGPLTREQFVAGFDAVMAADEQRIPDEQLAYVGVTWEKDDGSDGATTRGASDASPSAGSQRLFR